MQHHSSHSPIRPAILGIILAALFSLVVFSLVALPVRVEGTSMVPSLAPHQRLLVSPLFSRKNLRHADLVVLDHPLRPGIILIKRVAALPGDRLCINEKGIFVNDKRISSWTAGSCTPFMDLSIPQHTVFVLGDNLNQSMDSRVFGPLPITRIRGKVVLSYWPVSRFGIPR